MWRGNGEWTARDDLLAMALQLYEDSLCPDCGWSTYLTSDADYDGHFRIGERDCMGCKAREQWQDSQDRKNKQQHPRKGLKHYLWMKLHNPNGAED